MQKLCVGGVCVECRTCPGEWGWGKDPNSHWTDTGKTMDWKWGWGDKPTSQRSWTSTEQRSGEAQKLRATEGSTWNWIAPPFWGRSWPNRVAAVGQCSLPPVENNSTLTTLDWQTYLTSQLQLALWTERTKYYSQASYLVRPHQSSHLYANTRIGCQRSNSRTSTK
jgi:hypothetical protein